MFPSFAASFVRSVICVSGYGWVWETQGKFRKHSQRVLLRCRAASVRDPIARALQPRSGKSFVGSVFKRCSDRRHSRPDDPEYSRCILDRALARARNHMPQLVMRDQSQPQRTNSSKRYISMSLLSLCFDRVSELAVTENCTKEISQTPVPGKAIYW